MTVSKKMSQRTKIDKIICSKKRKYLTKFRLNIQKKNIPWTFLLFGCTCFRMHWFFKRKIMNCYKKTSKIIFMGVYSLITSIINAVSLQQIKIASISCVHTNILKLTSQHNGHLHKKKLSPTKRLRRIKIHRIHFSPSH